MEHHEDKSMGTIDKIQWELFNLRDRSQIALNSSATEKEQLVVENEAYIRRIASLEKEIRILSNQKKNYRIRNITSCLLKLSCGADLVTGSSKVGRCVPHTKDRSNQIIEHAQYIVQQKEQQIEAVQELHLYQKKQIEHVRFKMACLRKRKECRKRKWLLVSSNHMKQNVKRGEDIIQLRSTICNLEMSVQVVEFDCARLLRKIIDCREKMEDGYWEWQAHRAELQDQLEEHEHLYQQSNLRKYFSKENSMNSISTLQEHLSDGDDASACTSEVEMEVVNQLSNMNRLVQRLERKSKNEIENSAWWGSRKYDIRILANSSFDKVESVERMFKPFLSQGHFDRLLTISTLTNDLAEKVSRRETRINNMEVALEQLDLLASELRKKLKQLKNRVRCDSYKNSLKLDSLRKRLVYVATQVCLKEEEIRRILLKIQVCKEDELCVHGRLMDARDKLKVLNNRDRQPLCSV